MSLFYVPVVLYLLLTGEIFNKQAAKKWAES